MAERRPPTDAESERDQGPPPVEGDDGMSARVPGQVHRPVHLHLRFVLLVAAGGCVGALARYGLGLVLPAPGGWPLPTLLINLLGAFALGALLEGLSRRGPDTGRLRVVRLLVGTGFMGALTSYSTLAVDAVHLFDTGAAAPALLYLLASLFGGIGAVLAGIWIAARHHRASAAGKHGGLELPVTGEEQ